MAGDYMSTAWVGPTEAQHVLWHYGEGGLEPGAFVKALLTAIAHADYVNRDKLGLSYPGYVAGCNIAELQADGIATLTDIAASRRVEAEKW